MKQNSTNGRPSDVISYIKGQHDEIKALFAQVLEAQDAKRERLFTQLKTLLTVHEAAEEMVVHSEARKVITGGAAEVAAREKEEAAAKDALAELNKLDVDSPEFDIKLSALRVAVLSHALSEEKEELVPLERKLDKNKLIAMGKEAEAVEGQASRTGSARQI